MIDWLRRLMGLGGPLAPPPAAAHPPLPVIDPATAPPQGYAAPHFRFFPGAYEHEGEGEPVFRRALGPCQSCGMRDIHAYCGIIYAARREKPTVCAQCIAEGRIGEVLGREGYALHDAEVEGLDPGNPLVVEVQQRTPGFATFNPIAWPVHEGVPMAFMGYGDAPRWKDEPAVRTAIRAANHGEDCYPAPYALVFRSLDGSACRVVFDYD